MAANDLIDTVGAAAKAPRPKARRGSPGPTLQEQAINLLRNDIISGVLRPGEHINEAKLCERYKIGRTPVHQAIDRLRTQGLVEVLPRKGTIVRSISFDEVIQLAEARLVNEMEIARLAAARITPEEIAELDTLVVTMEAAHKDRNPQHLMQLDRNFHETIHRAARNPILADFLAMIYDRSMRVWYFSLSQRDYFEGIHIEHGELLDALRKGDAERAAKAMREHIMGYRDNLRRQL